MEYTPGSPASSEASTRSPAAHNTPDCRQCDRCSRNESLLCRYAGKKCRNARATKRNGSLHNLCDHHRIRANQNQRRMAHRIRLKQDRVQAAVSARNQLRSDESVARRADWAWPNTGFDPRIGHFPIAASGTYFPPPPAQFVRRDVSFMVSLAGNELLTWTRPNNAFASSATAASYESHFIDDFPWPELAPTLHHEGFVWSDQEFMASMVASGMPYSHVQ